MRTNSGVDSTRSNVAIESVEAQLSRALLEVDLGDATGEARGSHVLIEDGCVRIELDDEDGVSDFATNGADGASPARGGLSARPCKRQKYAAYVVFEGRVPGVYLNWDEASKQVSGYPNQCQAGFRTVEEARDAWNRACAPGHSPTSDQAAPGQGPHESSSTRGARFTTFLTASLTFIPVPRKFMPPKAPCKNPFATGTPGIPVLSPESSWYAVTAGQYPGVFEGRSIALLAAGHRGRRIMQKFATRSAANAAYVSASMDGEVKTIL
ncbi:hypothetical protein H0H92_014806 [Tricholoma furcatifolium]|nr:hypothetical protein H0H92_014806 [Tricholoma furcatifolium]